MTFCETDSETLNSPPITKEQNFDYRNLDTETRIVVQQRTSEIKVLIKRNAQDVFDIGQKLIEVKEKLGHGNFGPWLMSEFEWSIPAAARFMQVADRFKFIKLINLEIAASALYLLAAPSTPEEARAEALQLASEGETITYTKASGITSKHKPKPVTINTAAETVELISSIPVEFPPVTHTWQSEADQESEILGSEVEDWEFALIDPELDSDPIKEGDAPVLGQPEMPQPREESLQTLHSNSEERRTLAEGSGDRNRVAEMNSSPTDNGLAACEVSPDAKEYELPTVAVDAALACMREIDRLNTTFPSAGFYLGIQLEGFSILFDGVVHPLRDIFSVNYLREAVVLEKKDACSTEHSTIQSLPEHPAIATS